MSENPAVNAARRQDRVLKFSIINTAFRNRFYKSAPYRAYYWIP